MSQKFMASVTVTIVKREQGVLLVFQLILRTKIFWAKAVTPPATLYIIPNKIMIKIAIFVSRVGQLYFGLFLQVRNLLVLQAAASSQSLLGSQLIRPLMKKYALGYLCQKNGIRSDRDSLSET